MEEERNRKRKRKGKEVVNSKPPTRVTIPSFYSWVNMFFALYLCGFGVFSNVLIEQFFTEADIAHDAPPVDFARNINLLMAEYLGETKIFDKVVTDSHKLVIPSKYVAKYFSTSTPGSTLDMLDENGIKWSFCLVKDGGNNGRSLGKGWSQFFVTKGLVVHSSKVRCTRDRMGVYHIKVFTPQVGDSSTPTGQPNDLFPKLTQPSFPQDARGLSEHYPTNHPNQYLNMLQGTYSETDAFLLEGYPAAPHAQGNTPPISDYNLQQNHGYAAILQPGGYSEGVAQKHAPGFVFGNAGIQETMSDIFPKLTQPSFPQAARGLSEHHPTNHPNQYLNMLQGTYSETDAFLLEGYPAAPHTQGNTPPIGDYNLQQNHGCAAVLQPVGYSECIAQKHAPEFVFGNAGIQETMSDIFPKLTQPSFPQGPRGLSEHHPTNNPNQYLNMLQGSFSETNAFLLEGYPAAPHAQGNTPPIGDYNLQQNHGCAAILQPGGYSEGIAQKHAPGFVFGNAGIQETMSDIFPKLTQPSFPQGPRGLSEHHPTNNPNQYLNMLQGSFSETDAFLLEGYPAAPDAQGSTPRISDYNLQQQNHGYAAILQPGGYSEGIAQKQAPGFVFGNDDIQENMMHGGHTRMFYL